jgi:dipicolinate synthase subunit B
MGYRSALLLTGSYCTFGKVLPQVEELVQMGAEVFPIVSSSDQFLQEPGLESQLTG